MAVLVQMASSLETPILIRKAPIWEENEKEFLEGSQAKAELDNNRPQREDKAYYKYS